MKTQLFNNILSGLSDLFYPNSCETCGRPLHKEERILCLHCNVKLPRTLFHSQPENKAARVFIGRIPVERASAFLYFTKDGMTQHLLHRFKYNGKQDIGKTLGALLAAELQACNWANDIDVIVPVPLHKKKEKLRGFNQAEIFAQGLGNTLSIEVKPHWLERTTDTITQTKKSRRARLENVQDAFALHPSIPEEDKHILLVDDVLTTGATLEACALKLLQTKGTKVSILAIALATD